MISRKPHHVLHILIDHDQITSDVFQGQIILVSRRKRVGITKVAFEAISYGVEIRSDD